MKVRPRKAEGTPARSPAPSWGAGTSLRPRITGPGPKRTDGPCHSRALLVDRTNLQNRARLKVQVCLAGRLSGKATSHRSSGLREPSDPRAWQMWREKHRATDLCARPGCLRRRGSSNRRSAPWKENATFELGVAWPETRCCRVPGRQR